MENKVADSKFKMGIIGTGRIARRYVLQIKKMEDVEIVAAADFAEGRAEAFFEEFGVSGVRCYTDYRKLIDNEELDAVCICTYNATHAECTIYALEHGVNVLLEKPMSVTLDEAATMIKAEKKSGKILSIGFQPRIDNNMKRIKEICRSGELGKIYYIRIGGGRRRGIPNRTFIEKKTAGVGALGDIGCYALDMVLDAIGYPKPLTASGYKSAYFGTNPTYNNPEDAARFDVEDFAAAFVRLEGGVVIDFVTSWAMQIDTPGDTVFLGTEGALRIPSTECWNGTMSGCPVLYKDEDGCAVKTEIPLLPSMSIEELFFGKIRAFIDACRNGGVAPVPSSEIIYNQAIIDAIARSAELGREVEIVIPEF